jgi:hypothetical protein
MTNNDAAWPGIDDPDNDDDPLWTIFIRDGDLLPEVGLLYTQARPQDSIVDGTAAHGETQTAGDGTPDGTDLVYEIRNGNALQFEFEYQDDVPRFPPAQGE